MGNRQWKLVGWVRPSVHAEHGFAITRGRNPTTLRILQALQALQELLGFPRLETGVNPTYAPLPLSYCLLPYCLLPALQP